MHMDEGVNQSEEQTSLETSQVSEEESTNDESDYEDFSSSEDVNTQSEDEEGDLVSGAMDEVQAPKSKNRVQELANENRSLREKLAEREAQEMQIMQERARYSPNPNDYLATKVAQTDYKLAQMEDRSQWAEAARENPLLDRKSESYSREFDDLVYSNLMARREKGEYNLTPTQVARDLSGYLDQLVDRRTAGGQIVRETKRAINPVGGQRNPSLSETSGQSNQYQKFLRTGDWEDAVDLI